MAMLTVIQRRLSRAQSGGVWSKLRMTLGIKPPMMMRYEVDTPAHLMAMAASKSTVARG